MTKGAIMRALVETCRTVGKIARTAGMGLIAGLAALGSDAAMAASQSLSPGMTIVLPGTTAASEPDLVGPSTTIKQQFSIRNSAGAILCTGWLEQMLVRSNSTHFFHFYYRIIKTSGSGAITRFTPSGFGALSLSVAYRHDLPLGIRPRAAFRGLLGDDIGFQFDPPLSCTAHQGTVYVLIKPDADQVYCRPCAATDITATTGDWTYTKTWKAVH
jgi:hypothetical protein